MARVDWVTCRKDEDEKEKNGERGEGRTTHEESDKGLATCPISSIYTQIDAHEAF